MNAEAILAGGYRMKIILTAAACCALGSATFAHQAPPVPKAPLDKSADVQKPHSGGTDKNGCHKDHKNGDFHCH